MRQHVTSWDMLDCIKHYAKSLDSMRQHEKAEIGCMRYHETTSREYETPSDIMTPEMTMIHHETAWNTMIHLETLCSSSYMRWDHMQLKNM